MKNRMRNHWCGFILLFALSCHFFGISQTGLVQIGTGNSSTDQFPILSSYEENYAQIIYTASELQSSGMQAGTLTKIKFRTQNTVSTQGWDVWDIYMGHTSQSAFAADDA